MPKRIVTIPARQMMLWMSRHEQIVLAILSFALVIALGVAVAGWAAARNAEEHVNKLEVERAAELVAREQGEKLSQVVTCFNTSRSRPLLTTILRAMAGSETDPAVRTAINLLISNYENSSVPGVEGTPTEDKCIALAHKLHIDPTPYAKP